MSSWRERVHRYFTGKDKELGRSRHNAHKSRPPALDTLDRTPSDATLLDVVDKYNHALFEFEHTASPARRHTERAIDTLTPTRALDPCKILRMRFFRAHSLYDPVSPTLPASASSSPAHSKASTLTHTTVQRHHYHRSQSMPAPRTSYSKVACTRTRVKAHTVS